MGSRFMNRMDIEVNLHVFKKWKFKIEMDSQIINYIYKYINV